MLSKLGYNKNPSHLQALIRKIFHFATEKISIPGTEVIPCPLYSRLHGRNTEDYCARVEPSASGGKKMAELILEALGDGGAQKMRNAGISADVSLDTRTYRMRSGKNIHTDQPLDQPLLKKNEETKH